MKPQHTPRPASSCCGLAALGIASALVLNAFQSNLVFFFSPSQIAANEAPRERSFRVGGLVEEGSVKRDARRPDRAVRRHRHRRTSVPVVYTGLLPDLFKEGKGVVAQGKLGADGVFQAEQVLAKHDENYMPPEAAEALQEGARHRRSCRHAGSTANHDSRNRPLRADRSRCVLALVQASLPLAGASRGNAAWMALARPAARGQFLFVALAFGCLTWAFVHDDFSVLLAANHSNSLLPLHYRFAAVWGTHEGSILLWLLILAGWTLAVAELSNAARHAHACRACSA